MSQIYKAFFGAVAITFALGAAQLASGHDLADRWQAVADKADKPAITSIAPASPTGSPISSREFPPAPCRCG